MELRMDHAIDRLRKPEDLMSFFDDFIRYGCVDADGKEYIDSLGGSDFREKFRTLSLEDSLEHRIGACVEQANITKYLLDRMGVRGRMFCTRGYNAEHCAPNDLYLIHCYVLAYFDGKVMNIEHSDSEKRGIYVYDSEEEALRETHKMFSDKFIQHGAVSTTLDEYTQFIPGGLSFLGVNEYINTVGIAKTEVQQTAKNLSPFCTCTKYECPLHPQNHDRGCAPCIAKNLKKGEVPNCFFNKAGISEHTDDSYRGFAEAILKSHIVQ